MGSDDTSVVVFGSLARDEFTPNSDIDWTLLVDGLANPQHLDTAFAIDSALDTLDAKSPGREGTFGGLAFGHDIIHNIGGGDDTNRNLTQRILLLLESWPVGNSAAWARIRRNVLKRYILEDYGWLHKSGPYKVPRFLQNDFARYWRTVAVDFAYKRRQRRGQGWALRTVKLRLSRKLTYASGLLGCFSCDFDDIPIDEPGNGDLAATHPVVRHLEQLFSATPLEILARYLLEHLSLREAASLLFDSYDGFLGFLSDSEIRTHLADLSPADAATDERYQEARSISHRFQEGLTRLFLEENDTPLFNLTRTYGVF